MYELLQHLINGVAAGTIYALVALGYTMVYGVLRLINFAHGDVMMVGVYIGYATALGLGSPRQSTWYGVIAVFAASMAFCALLGYVIERFAYRPLRDKPRLAALITAIGISFALSYGFQFDLKVKVFGTTLTLLPGAASRRFPDIIEPKEVFVFGDDVIIWNWQLIALAIAFVMLIGLQYVVYRTRFGKAMRAVSFDHRTAALMGIPINTVVSRTFMLGSALAAGAGILYAIKDKSIQPLMGTLIGLKAFVAAVIGGIGILPGAVAGGFLLGLCEEIVVGYGPPALIPVLVLMYWVIHYKKAFKGTAWIPYAVTFLGACVLAFWGRNMEGSTWRDAVAFGFLIVVLLVRPQGLFGTTEAEKV